MAAECAPAIIQLNSGTLLFTSRLQTHVINNTEDENNKPVYCRPTLIRGLWRCVDDPSREPYGTGQLVRKMTTAFDCDVVIEEKSCTISLHNDYN